MCSVFTFVQYSLHNEVTCHYCLCIIRVQQVYKFRDRRIPSIMFSLMSFTLRSVYMLHDKNCVANFNVGSVELVLLNQ